MTFFFFIFFLNFLWAVTLESSEFLLFFWKRVFFLFMFVPRSPRVPCPARQWGLCHCFRITSGSSVPPIPHPLLGDLQLPSSQSLVPSEGSAAHSPWATGWAWSHTQSSSHRFQILNVTNFRDNLVLLTICNDHSEVTKGISVSRAQTHKKQGKTWTWLHNSKTGVQDVEPYAGITVTGSWVPKCFSQILSQYTDWILHAKFQGK